MLWFWCGAWCNGCVVKFLDLVASSPSTERGSIDNAVIITHDRQRTEPWPNPWSHPLPTFSYSVESKLISVKFYADPLVSDDWPRPESEWKDKEFVLAASAPVPTQIRGFRVIAKWAPASAKSTRRWTTRVGHRCHDQTNLAVEEKLKNIIPRDFNRMKWEIETPWSQAVVKVSVAILVAIQIKLSLLVWTNCMCGSDSTITFRGPFNFSCNALLWNVHHDKRSLRMGLLEGNTLMVRSGS